jgi:hypothetical protein
VRVDTILNEAYRLAWQAQQPNMYASTTALVARWTVLTRRAGGSPYAENDGPVAAAQRCYFWDLPLDGPDGSLVSLTAALARTLNLTAAHADAETAATTTATAAVAAAAAAVAASTSEEAPAAPTGA